MFDVEAGKLAVGREAARRDNARGGVELPNGLDGREATHHRHHHIGEHGGDLGSAESVGGHSPPCPRRRG